MCFVSCRPLISTRSVGGSLLSTAIRIAGLVTQEARGHFQRIFVDRSGHGTAMAVQATVGLEDPATIAGSCAALASALAEAWRAAPNR